MGLGSNRRNTRPCARRGTSVSAPAIRSVRAPGRLAATSDQVMWWGWVVAVAFVLAGLSWHLFTYRGEVSRQAESSCANRSVEFSAPYGE